MMKKILISNNGLVILSIFCYLVSLNLAAVYTKIPTYTYPDYWEPKAIYSGWHLLLIGWLGFFSFVPAWFANISYYITLVFFLKKEKPCITLSYLTLFLALTTFFYEKLPADSGRYTEYISYFSVGFYCWLLSFFILVVACHRRQLVSKE